MAFDLEGAMCILVHVSMCRYAGYTGSKQQMWHLCHIEILQHPGEQCRSVS